MVKLLQTSTSQSSIEDNTGSGLLIKNANGVFINFGNILHNTQDGILTENGSGNAFTNVDILANGYGSGKGYYGYYENSTSDDNILTEISFGLNNCEPSSSDGGYQIGQTSTAWQLIVSASDIQCDSTNIPSLSNSRPYSLNGTGDSLTGCVNDLGSALVANVQNAGTLNLDINSVGLVGYWKLNEISGSTNYDYSGNGVSLTESASPPIMAGKFGIALNFTASKSQYTSGSASSLPTGAGARTVTVWVYPMTLGTNQARQIMGYGGGTDGFNIGIESTGDIGFNHGLD